MLLSSHHVEAETLVCLGQLDHAGVGVALGGSEGGHGGLGRSRGPEMIDQYNDSKLGDKVWTQKTRFAPEGAS